MLKRVPYLAKDTVNYRPHTELIFYNEKTNLSFSTIALIDSGADSIVVPYSLGTAIGLEPKQPNEELQIMNGIGGGITYVVRDCLLALTDAQGTKYFCFKNTIHWLHPSEELIGQLQEQQDIIEWCSDSLALPEEKKYKSIINAVLENYQNQYLQTIALFEGETLLGRPFFNNLVYIQFIQKDRPWDCKVVYQVDPRKILLEVPLKN